MSGKHTPGPWFLEGNWDPNGSENVGGWVSSNPPSGLPVFELNPCVGLKAEICANARLIAAAPEMAEAMREFVARVDAGEVRSKRTYAKFKEILTAAGVL